MSTDLPYAITLEKRVIKFIGILPPKHKEQIKRYLLGLCINPCPHDSQPLIHYEPYRRGDCGEYRIIYRFDESERLVAVLLVGKRNGGEVYKSLRGLLR